MQSEDRIIHFGVELIHTATRHKKDTLQKLYFELEDRGYPTRVVPATVMAKYIAHIGHATLVVNRPQNVREKAIRTYRRLHGKIFDSELARALLEDESLDK